MCGIAGVFDSETPQDRSLLVDMNRCLAHRGPDDEGIHIQGPIGLAHKRLSIIDLETGRQPIFNEDGSICVVFNGEIYNYTDLRDSLSSVGHTFSSATDTEVLVHLYEEYGPSFVERLQGMFAFALWDADEKRLVLARDRMGIKPLLLLSDGDRVAFASELPALLETNIDHGGLNRTALAMYFGFGFIPAPKTAFKNIEKIQPGERVVISAGDIRRDQFYVPSIQSTAPGLDQAATILRHRIERAVERRLQSDVPIGTFLSGGIDSSIVVGILSECLDESIRTFTVGFEAELFDEAWAAREVAEHYGTNHTEFTVTADAVRATIPAVLRRLGEPFGDQSLIPTYVVARETRSDVKVALSGDGADELFAGYNRYRGEFFSRYYRLIPELLRRQTIDPLVERLPASRDSRTGELGRKVKRFIRGDLKDRNDRHFEWMRIPDEQAIETVDLHPTETCRRELHEQHESIRSWLPRDRQDALGEMQAVDIRFSLPNQMLHKIDTAGMYNSLEVRVPFLDTTVVEYTLSLPTDYKTSIRTRKRVLKLAFEDVLPPTILNRRKRGFDMPVGEWFKDELADEFVETVRGLETKIVDVKGVMDIYNEHVTNHAEHGKFLWLTYVFATWLRRMRRNGILTNSL